MKNLKSENENSKRKSKSSSNKKKTIAVQNRDVPLFPEAEQRNKIYDFYIDVRRIKRKKNVIKIGIMIQA